MVELQVHLTERFLHVQTVLGRHLQQAATVPPKGTDGTDRTGVAGSWPAAILPSADTVFRERCAAPQRVITNLSTTSDPYHRSTPVPSVPI